MTTKKLLRAL